MPKKSRAFHCAGLVFCLGGLSLAAAAVPAAGVNAPFIVNSWSAESGLPDSEVISVIQTRDGYLWLGTLHGLVRFDGTHFAVFNRHNLPGLSSDRIVYLFQDSRADLWVGTESSGVDRIHNGAITHFETENVAGGGKVIYASEDSAGDIWFSTATRTFFRYHAGKMDFFPGIAAPQLQMQAAGLLAPARNMLIPSKSGGSWQIFNGTVLKLENDGRTRDFGPAPWGSLFLTAACEDQDGNLVVGTLGAGVFWYQPDGQYWSVSTNQGLSSVYVLSLCVDRQGNLWAGTDGGGLDRIRRKTFTMPEGLHPWAAQSMSEDGRGGLWVAFGALGATHWTTNGSQDFQVGPSAHDAWEVLVDRRQQVWAGTHGEGLFRLDGNQFVPAPGAMPLGSQIFALFEDHGGVLWAGTQAGLARNDGDTWKLFTTSDGLSGNSIRAIAEDSRGGLWVGTEDRGLNYLADGKFAVYRAGTNGLPGDDISCLCVDQDGALWVGTSGHGLALLQNGRWKTFSTDDGLASDSISYLLEDDAGYLWIGSNAGLMRIPKKALADFSAGGTNVLFCRIYGKADGLPTMECSAGAQPAAARTADGRFWFPTTKGLASVQPSGLRTNPQPPAVMIESMRVDGREQDTNRLAPVWSRPISIPPGGGQVEIDYTALNFSAPELVRFRYWLEGHENGWTDARDERVARFPNLPPGRYTFHVTACNEDGIWNPTGSALILIVQPFFWQTSWFRWAAILFTLGLVAAVVRYVSTQKLQRQLLAHQQREALEHERARIARDLHDQIGANLTQVALLGEMAEADKDAPAEIELHAQQISHTARETTRSLDEIVWAVNPANDTLDGLVNYAGKYAQEYLALAGLRCRADLPAQLPAVPIPPEVRHNVFLAFKEAVHNVVKHAQATEARIRLRLEPGRFTLEVEDNGRGLGDPSAPRNRNGLRNMKKRMGDIRGEFSIDLAPEHGTIVRLVAPINLNHG